MRENEIVKNRFLWYSGRGLFKIQIITLFCLFYFHFSSFGINYYVSTTGRDTLNDGLSEMTAWRTLGYAARKVVAGDIVYIKAGIYKNEYVSIRNSGTANAPIIFQGYQNTPGEILNYQYIPGSRIDSTLMPVINGTGISDLGITLWDKSYITFRNIGVTNYTDNGVLFQKSDHIILEKIIATNFFNSSTGGGFAIQFQNNCSKMIIRDCVVADAGMTNIWIINTDNCLIENCKSYAVVNEPQLATTDYHIAIMNTQNSIVRNCQAYNLHWQKGGHQGHAIGIKDQAGDSIYLYTHSYNNTITDCEAYNMGEFFYVSHEAYNNKITNCKAIGSWPSFNNGWADGLVLREGAHDNVFSNITVIGARNSLLFQDSEEGLFDVNAKPIPQICKNNIISNCTFVNSNKGIEVTNADSNLIKNCIFDKIEGIFCQFTDSSIANTGNIVKNSIITNITGYFIVDGPYVSTNFNNKISFKYTNFWDNKFTMPTGEGNLALDPQFVDPANYDYHLKSTQGHWDISTSTWKNDEVTSPCIDNGQPNDDFNLEPSPNGNNIDMGAHGGTIEASKSPKESNETKTVNSISNTDEGGLTIYPNPFSVSSTITYTSSTSGYVKITLYDIQGRIIRNLLDENIQSGSQSINWDGTNSNGQKISNGIYLLKLKTESGINKTYKIFFRQ